MGKMKLWPTPLPRKHRAKGLDFETRKFIVPLVSWKRIRRLARGVFGGGNAWGVLPARVPIPNHSKLSSS